MEAFKEFISFTNGLVWGADNIPYPPVLLLLLGTGLFLTIRLGFMPIRKIPYAIGQLFNKSQL